MKSASFRMGTIFRATCLLMFVVSGCDHRAIEKPGVYLGAIKGIEVQADDLPVLHELDAGMQKLTLDGKVFVQSVDDGKTAFLFVTWRGKGTNFQGVLVCEGLQIDQLEKDSYERPNLELEVPQWDTDFKMSGSWKVPAYLEATDHVLVFIVGFDLD